MRQKRNDTGELSFHLLKCLVALVDHSHVSRAADALLISQPAMSRAMSQLRAVTNDPILVKGGSGLIPTAKAVQLREFADRILQEMNRLLGNAVAFDPSVTRHEFRMVVSDYMEFIFMERLLRHLGTAFPGIGVSVRHPVHPSQFTKVLETGEVDFAVGILPSTLHDLRHRPLFKDRIVCAARAGHRAAGKKLSIEEFSALEHLVIKPNVANAFGEIVDMALEKHDVSRNRRYVTPNYLTAPQLVGNSDMVALLPELLLTRFRSHIDLVEIHMPIEVPPFDIYLSWHDRTHRHAAHMWFREQVMKSLDPERVPSLASAEKQENSVRA
ncbi:LysR family transcriptional regulator [Variovorax sp. YR216]|uniref:LysR family transcriptional regulator n=1 Tax=Variovorax sp. YR216 TaxID=1882828 RepID=UPI000898E8BD|nr:LysR family transcriptional regulator [Variovorax sp. YR216]SDZ99926.1 transcriptional regulator, LysR family [Variovorax sp. YR216]